ncbi:hypothetical protein FOL47_010705 [Perkinsus chesapeaki]|uniref:Diacylglycerol O-acyltransferase n=1 Tax=Perkinsus chesapeaki TaxID=330153 RepID=A0A7J6L392_PERCH|nr:hypothetical protein FOL47_010705 [Perkinsus chesapeaki]
MFVLAFILGLFVSANLMWIIVFERPDKMLHFGRYRSRILTKPSFFGLDASYHLEDLGEGFDVISIIEEFEACDIPRRYAKMSAVEALLENTITKPFGDELPPIRFYLIHNDDGGTTIVSELHHALADGFSSIMALLELTDTLEKSMPLADTASVGSTNASDSCAKVYETKTERIWKILMKLLTLLWQWIKHVPWALYMLLVFSVIPDSYTSLRPTFGKRGRSEVRCGTEVSLEDLKIVSKATGSKINDVILALLAGTARRYLLAEALKKGVDEIRDPARLRMGFQFTANMRSLSGEPSIGGGGNESWVFAVPVCLDADLQKRIKNVQLQTGRLKRSPAFLFGKVFTRCCGFFMNFPIFRRLLINCICGERYIFGKTLTVTNVPGPRAPRSVCGEAIQRLSVYVSHSQTFSVITYNGKVSTIIVTDSEWVDAELMRECYNEEVEQAVLAFRSAEKGIEGLSHTRS